MTTTSEEELIALVVGWVQDNRITSDSNDIEVSGNTNLFESGFLDSFAFVELLLFIESYTGTKIDLIDASAEEFTVIKQLCRLALRNTIEREPDDIDTERDCRKVSA